jgi:hypothetical protein
MPDALVVIVKGSQGFAKAGTSKHDLFGALRGLFPKAPLD